MQNGTFCSGDLHAYRKASFCSAFREAAGGFWGIVTENRAISCSGRQRNSVDSASDANSPSWRVALGVAECTEHSRDNVETGVLMVISLGFGDDRLDEIQ